MSMITIIIKTYNKHKECSIAKRIDKEQKDGYNLQYKVIPT